MIRLGTRRSALATTQSDGVAEMVRALGHEVELVLVTTEGDVNRAPLTQIGGTGVFVSALRDALLRHTIDIAVHSLKDLPTGAAEGLVVAAIPPREDPSDVVVARDGMTLAQLPAGAVVGTGSPRRAGQLALLHPELVVRPIRGNIDTRMGYVTSGDLDAVILARAGLARLGRLDAVTETLDPATFLPAPGQGALAVECRATDIQLREVLAELDDAATRRAVTAERAVLSLTHAGCSAPVGAWATEDESGMTLRAFHGDAQQAYASASGAADAPYLIARDVVRVLVPDPPPDHETQPARNPLTPELPS